MVADYYFSKPLWLIVIIFQVYKAGNTNQETSLRPFYCNYNFTCSISVHTQTLNKYPDAENTFEYQNNERISRQTEYSFQPYFKCFLFSHFVIYEKHLLLQW